MTRLADFFYFAFIMSHEAHINTTISKINNIVDKFYSVNLYFFLIFSFVR